MRRFAPLLAIPAAAAVAASLSVGSAGAATLATPTTDPADAVDVTDPVATTESGAGLAPVTDTIEIDPSIAPTIVVDSSGSPIAAIGVLAVDPDWGDYDDRDAPRSGHQYVRISVVVESRSARGLFEVLDRHFVLQDADGFVFTGDVVATAAQRAAGESVVDRAALANGDQVQLELTFRVVAGVAPDTLFYVPSHDRLVTVADIGR